MIFISVSKGSIMYLVKIEFPFYTKIKIKNTLLWEVKTYDLLVYCRNLTIRAFKEIVNISGKKDHLVF